MLQLKKSENNIEIVYNNNALFVESKKKPFLFYGIENVQYLYKNGYFTIKDKTKYVPAFIKDAKQDGKTIELSYDFDGTLFCITLTEKDSLEINFTQVKNPIILNLCASKTEHIFGAGEHFRKVDLKGEKVKIFVEEHTPFNHVVSRVLHSAVNIKDEHKPFESYKTYFVQPTFISSDTNNNRNYLLLAEIEKIAFFDFKKDITSLNFHDIPKKIIIKETKSVKESASELAKLQGILPSLPKWIYDGMILGIQGGDEVCNSKLNTMLENGCKINGIWSQDWCGDRITSIGKRVFWDYTIDDKRLYPNYKENIKNWSKKGVAWLGYINPYLCTDGELFKEAKEKNFLVLDNEGKDPFIQLSQFPFGIVDITKPEAYDWYKDVIKKYTIDIGIKGWMADFGEYLPTNTTLYGGKGEDLHNIYATIWAKLNREAVEETENLGNLVFFMRSGFLYSPKYSTAYWNGDNMVDFSSDYGFGSAIKAAINMGYSGIGLSHSDVGGYTTAPKILNRTKELYLRWLETNAFIPFLRSHEGNNPWVNFQFDGDEESIKAMAKFTTIYSKLKEYFESCDKDYQKTGTPILRSLYMNYEEEQYSNIDDELFVGDDLLICPVLKSKATKRKVVLPFDCINIMTGETLQKGEHTVDAPLGTPAVFYKKDSKHTKVFENIK